MTAPEAPPQPTPLQKWQSGQLRMIAESVLWLMRYAQVPDVHGTEGARPFAAWRHIVALLRSLQSGQSLCILKARQVGISWAISLYALWLAMTRANSLVVIISKTGADAGIVLDHCRFMYDHFPDWLREAARVRAYSQGKDGNGELSFIGGGSIVCLAATPNAGRGMTPTLVVFDEFAYHPWAEKGYTAIKPALDGGGQIVIASTAAGPRGTFHRVYVQARQGLSSIKAVFLPWWSRPNRMKVAEDGEWIPSERWLEKTKADFIGITAEFRQEFPATEREAWVVLTGLVYGIANDGTDRVIFDGRSYPQGNLSPDPCKWDDCKWHYASVDWGGGDPTAVGLYGVTSSGRAHKFYEGHWVGSTSAMTIAQFILDHRPPNGFDAIVCGADESVSISTLRELFAGYNDWVKAAETARKLGFGLSTHALLTRRLTFNEERCPYSIGEFGSYSWKNASDSNTGERYATKAPEDHHGDHCDEMRYFVAEWLGGEDANSRDPDEEFELVLT